MLKISWVSEAAGGPRALESGEDMSKVTAKEVRDFWERNPLGAADIPFEAGSDEFFEAFESLRQALEPTWVQQEIYEYDRFQGKAILDVGCGNGYVVSRYARWGAITTGMDLTRRAVEITRKRFAIDGFRGSFVQGDAESLPFRDETFDLVTAMGVLHHIPDPKAAVREIRRVLRQGGRFVMMLYHKNSFFYRICVPLYRRFHRKFKRWSSEDLVKHVDGAENPLGRVYTRCEAEQLLEGFREIRSHLRSLPQKSIPKIGRFIPQRILDVASRWIGWFLYVKALK